MIIVQVKRATSSNDIESITIDGHAGYADPGYDIVCAAVSGISLGMMNAVEMLLGVKLPVSLGESGFLHCEIPKLEQEKHERVQLMLDAMIASLQSVAIEYSKFIKVRDINANRRWI